MSTRSTSIGRASLTIDVELKKLTSELKLANTELRSSTRQMRRSIGGLEGAAKQLDNTIGRTFRNFRNLGGAALAVTAALQVRHVVQYADAWTRLNQQLGTVFDNSKDVAAAQERLFSIAQGSRAAIGAVADVYVRFARATADTNIEQETLFKSVQNLTESITLAGVSAIQAEAGMLQLAQGFAKGRLDGDELRSVLENIPVLGTAIAKEMGVAVGALRDLGAEGRITQEVMIRAFERLPGLIGDIADAPVTVSQAFTLLSNSMGRFVGTVDQAIGASASLAGAINLISDAVDSATQRTADLERVRELIEAGGNFNSIFDKIGGRGDIEVERLIKNLKSAEAADARLLSLNKKITDERGKQADVIAGIRKIREADAESVKKAAEEASLTQVRAIQQQQAAADKLIATFEQQVKIGALDGAERQLAEALQSIGAGFDVIGDKVANASVHSLDEFRNAIEKTSFSDARAEIEGLAASLESQARVAALSEGAQRDLGTELTKLGASFGVFNGALADVDLPEDDLRRLSEAIGDISFAETGQKIAKFITDMERQSSTVALSTERQKRLAEALQSIGIAFDVVGGKIRSSVADQQQLNTLADALDANAYTQLQATVSDYVDQINRAIRAEGLASDQQREIAGLLDELGIAWQNVAGQVRAVSNEVSNADLSRLTEAFDTAKIDEAQRKLSDFVKTARLNQQVAGLSSATQKEFAASLRSMGIEFEIVGGKVRVLNESIAGTDEALKAIETKQAAEKFNELKKLGEDFGKSVTDGIADVILESKKLSDVFDGLIKQIARMALQQAIGGGVSSIFGSLFTGTVTGTTGASTGGGTVNPSVASAQAGARFATGGIIRGPVAIGNDGVAGEAGPEAIVPLSVGAGGKLGIDASGIGGGGTNVIVNDFRNSGADVEVQETEQDGQQVLELTIKDEVNRLAAQGSLDGAFGSFGSNRRPVRR